MQPNELKAVLATTKEVAAYPAHIESQLPYPIGERAKRNRFSVYYCPTGLKRAVVIEDGHKWTERRPISQCGDQDYTIERRNGVLVEFELDDFVADERFNFVAKGDGLYQKEDKTFVSRYPHAAVVTHEDGRQTIQMVVSRKAILATWAEYAMIEAQREAERQREREREDAIRQPQAAIMGMTREEFEKTYVNNSDERDIYLRAEYDAIYKQDAKGKILWETVPGYGEKRVVKREIGKIEITLDQANKILGMLTKKQKEMLKP